jgi:hypothetical protein
LECPKEKTLFKVPNPISSMRLGTEYGDKPLAGNHGYILGTDESPPVCRRPGNCPPTLMGMFLHSHRGYAIVYMRLLLLYRLWLQSGCKLKLAAFFCVRIPAQ